MLLLLAVLPYLGVLGNDFVYIFDDKALILDNPYVHNFHHLPELLTSGLWANLGPQRSAPYYRPLATWGFLLCYQVFGPAACGFHLVSLLLNAVVVALVFVLAQQLLEDRLVAFASAALFALHPVHVEPMAWIADVTDLEVTLFYGLTFWCFLRMGNSAVRHRQWLQAGMALSFILATLAKEQALTLPLLAVIYEHFYRRDGRETPWKVKLRRYGPLWLVGLAYFLLRRQVLGAFTHPTGMHELSTRQVIFSAVALAGQYCGLLFLPLHLTSFHPFHPSASFRDAGVIWGAAALALSAAMFGFLWKGARPASFGILWLFLTLAPALNARWLSSYVLGERYLYLPSVGFCLVVGWGVALLWRTTSRRGAIAHALLVAAAGMLATLCVLRISLRVLDWRSDITLFSQALAAAPGDFRLHDALGQAYWFRQNSGGAEREWQESLRLEPNSVQALNSLGALYGQQKQFDRARRLLEKAIRLDPTDTAPHLTLGAIDAETGDIEGAEEHFTAAVSLSPTSYTAHNLLGKVYFDSQRLPQAELQFRASLNCEPNLAAYDHLGYIYARWGDRDRAERAFQAALALNAADSHAHFHLGLIYAATGRTAMAVNELQAAQAADPGNPEIRAALEKLRR